MTTDLQKTDTQTALVPADVSAGALQSALAGDLSKLPEPERLKFYGALCQFTGLNPLGKPFDWLVFQNKLTLYANKGCAEQLRKIHGVSLEVVERKVEHGCLIIRVKATDKSGRIDEAMAALAFSDKMGADAAAMAMMKCETKAKRRVTLSICGLSLLVERDEEAVPGATTTTATDVTNVETAQDRAAKLNEALNQTATIEAEVVPEKVKEEPPKPEAKPEVEPDPFADAPFVPNGSEMTEDEKRAIELQTIFGENKDCIPYLIVKGKLPKGADLTHVNKAWADSIIKQPQKFLQLVETWVKGGKK